MRTTRTMACVALCGACAGLTSACGDPRGPGGDAGAVAPSGSAVALPAASASASAAPEPDHVELLRFTLTSGVKAKDPVDLLDAAPPGQRVYGHLTVRNRTDGPKRVTLSFRVNGSERSLVDLQVEKSWSWRTWAYVTLRKEDKGELTVYAFDDHGAALAEKSIPIR